jgi:hypothetical protein
MTSPTVCGSGAANCRGLTATVTASPGAGIKSAASPSQAEVTAQFFTKEELAGELGRNMRTLDRWEALGIGPPRTLVGRKILYRRTSVQRWLAAQENQGHSDAAAERSSAREFRGAL